MPQLQTSNIDQRILAKLAELDQRFIDLEARMNLPEVASKPQEIVRLSREHAQLSRLVGCFREYRKLHEQHSQAAEMAADPAADPELQQMAQEEEKTLAEQARAALDKAKGMLVMNDDAAIDSVIMEIRAGTGGDEAALFARDLYNMYTRYCEKRGWKIEQMEFSASEMGGFREIIFGIKGEGVWQALGYEGGGHRVQRVPETETQGRIHTSAATVAVLPEPEEVDVEIRPEDVIENVCRAGGPGGQNVNKVSSAVRLEHVPTGITVNMRDERSQIKNRTKAWRILRSRIYDLKMQKIRAERAQTRKTMIGSGDRSERIRTYNFPQNRLTDHRINLSLYYLDKIILGEMDELIGTLIDYDKQQRLEAI